MRVALDVVEARLKVGGFDETHPVSATDDEIHFDVDLAAGQHRIQTWFTQRNGMTGADYYTDIAPVDSQEN